LGAEQKAMCTDGQDKENRRVGVHEKYDRMGANLNEIVQGKNMKCFNVIVQRVHAWKCSLDQLQINEKFNITGLQTLISVQRIIDVLMGVNQTVHP
jgi:hypothetical protein